MLPPRVFRTLLVLLGVSWFGVGLGLAQTPTASPSPAPSPLPLLDTTCDAPGDNAIPCYEALREDVKWVAAYLQAKREEAANKPAQDERLAKRIAALQSKNADLETPEGTLKQAQELLDLFFELKARKLEDKSAAAPLEQAFEKAAEPLARLNAAIHTSPPALVDAQVLADVRLAVTRLLGIAKGLQQAATTPAPNANGCTSEQSIWCFGLIGSGTQDRDARKDERRVTNPRIYLVEAYAAYKKLPKCNRDSACERARLDARRALLDALEPEGLRPFIVGFIKPAFLVAKAEKETKAEQALIVRFATRPSGGALSLGVIGQFGRSPVLDLLEKKPTDDFANTTTDVVQVQRDGSFTVRNQVNRNVVRKCPADKAGKPEEWNQCPIQGLAATTFQPTLQGAFIWDVGLRASCDFGRQKWTASAVGRVGQTVRITDFAAAKLKDAAGTDTKDEVFAAQLVGEDGDSNWYYEAGLQIQAFDTTLGNREARDLNVRRAVLTAEAGLRWDRRFRNNPALMAAPKIYGDQPQKRWYARFALDRLPVFSDGTATGSGKPDFSLSFAVDYEGKVGGLGLPSTTRIYVAGNLGFKL